MLAHTVALAHARVMVCPNGRADIGKDRNMITVSLCESCIWADAYGEVLPDSDGVPLSKLAGQDIGSLPCEHGYDCGACDSPSSEGYFGRHCDGCDTAYAGNRYDHVIVAR